MAKAKKQVAGKAKTAKAGAKGRTAKQKALSLLDEIFEPLADAKQIVIMILTAMVYMMLLIPLKSFTIIPGFAEFRVANFVPVLFGILFGPAAAWGSAIGNLGADFFGTLGAGSIFGFIGNFLYAYLAYWIWHRFTSGEKITLGFGQLLVFWLAVLAASLACAVAISAGIFALGLLTLNDALLFFVIVFFNNLLPSMILGPILLKLCYNPLKKAGLIYNPAI